MKVKVATLSGYALDWAVAVMWGLKPNVSSFGPLFGKGYLATAIRCTRFSPTSTDKVFSTDWEAFGRLMQALSKWGCRINCEPSGVCTVVIANHTAVGANIKEAVCRAYVLARLDTTDEIEVPEELLPAAMKAVTA